jgi:hypothetical protein
MKRGNKLWIRLHEKSTDRFEKDILYVLFIIGRYNRDKNKFTDTSKIHYWLVDDYGNKSVRDQDVCK